MKRFYEEPWFDTKKFSCSDIMTDSNQGPDYIGDLTSGEEVEFE